MISNAGIIVTKRLFEVSVAEWDKVQQVFTTCQPFYNYLTNSTAR